MFITTDLGLVLRRRRHNEEDVQTTYFLKNTGKISVIAKGGMKPHSKLKALLEPFAEVDVQLALPFHGIHGRLISGRALHTHRLLRSRFESFQVASRSCETVDLLLPYRASSVEVYDILGIHLRRLEHALSPQVEWIIFSIELFKRLGYGDSSAEINKFLPNFFPLKSTEAVSSSLSRQGLHHAGQFIQSKLSGILPSPLNSWAIEKELAEFKSK